MAKKTESNTQDSAAKRGGGYPYYPYARCMGLAEVVKRHGGERGAVPRSVIASDLGMEDGSASFAQLVGSAKTFGLVDFTRGPVSLTESGRHYFYPTTDAESRLAELSFLTVPPTFAALVAEFDGSVLPSVQMIANVLGRKHHVPESWKLRAAQIFMGAATELGVLDQSGFLRYEAAKHMIAPGRGGAPRPASDQEPIMSGQPATPIVTAAGPFYGGGSSGDTNVWVFSEAGGTVKLETPSTLTNALWDRLQKYVDVLRPSNGPKEGKNRGKK